LQFCPASCYVIASKKDRYEGWTPSSPDRLEPGSLNVNCVNKLGDLSPDTNHNMKIWSMFGNIRLYKCGIVPSARIQKFSEELASLLPFESFPSLYRR
jgi:hypothetical protein